MTGRPRLYWVMLGVCGVLLAAGTVAAVHRLWIMLGITAVVSWVCGIIGWRSWPEHAEGRPREDGGGLRRRGPDNGGSQAQ